MNRSELRDAVAAEVGLSGAETDRVIAATFDAIGGALEKKDKVALAGFGTFETRERAARQGRNPQTGETMQIAASTAPAFKPAAALKRRVSGD